MSSPLIAATAALLLMVGCAAESEPQEPAPAPAATETPGSTTADPAQAKSPPKEDCSTPYTVGQDGRKHYKLECLNGG